jgi:hypothetical protein
MHVTLGNLATAGQAFHLRSNMTTAKSITSHGSDAIEIDIPLPTIELVTSQSGHNLPTPGSRSEQLKILSTIYSSHSLTVKVAGLADTHTFLTLLCNQDHWPALHLGKSDGISTNSIRLVPGSDVPLEEYRKYHDGHLPPEYINLEFPEGQGWQTLEFTLTW